MCQDIRLSIEEAPSCRASGCWRLVSCCCLRYQERPLASPQAAADRRAARSIRCQLILKVASDCVHTASRADMKIWLLFCIFCIANGNPVINTVKNSLQRAVTFTEPTEPLEFRDNVKKKPRRKNLKKSRLLRKMGVDYKPEWMSMDEPSDLQNHVSNT